MRSTMRILIIAAVLMTLVGSVSARRVTPLKSWSGSRLQRSVRFRKQRSDYDSVYQGGEEGR